MFEVRKLLTVDDCFKSIIEVFTLSNSSKYFDYDNNWVLQVENINKYWDELIDTIDLSALKFLVLREAKELGIENAKEYNFEKALINAKTEWRKELILKGANYIASYYIDFDQDKVCIVAWKDNQIEIQWQMLTVKL